MVYNFYEYFRIFNLVRYFQLYVLIIGVIVVLLLVKFIFCCRVGYFKCVKMDLSYVYKKDNVNFF